MSLAYPFVRDVFIFLLYTTQPINPYLDAEAKDTYEIAYHPTISTEVLIHSLACRIIATMTKSKLQKLRNIYRLNTENTSLPKAIAELILRQKAKAYATTPITTHPLHKQNRKQTYQEPEWRMDNTRHPIRRATQMLRYATSLTLRPNNTPPPGQTIHLSRSPRLRIWSYPLH